MTGGFEWFGESPGHEVLTAYGLLQFREMERAGFYEIDWAVTERTQAWLMSHMTETGSFLQNSKQIDTFGYSPANISDAYIIWTLSESSTEDLTTSLNYLRGLADQTDDPYFLALTSLSFLNSFYSFEKVESYLLILKDHQQPDGRVHGAQTSITSSRFDDLTTETTALCALAWLKAGVYKAETRLAVQGILKTSKAGSFGGTQSTVLALKAILEFDKLHPPQPLGGSLELYLDEQLLDSLELSDPNLSLARLSSKTSSLSQLQLKWVGAGRQSRPFSCEVSTRTPLPPAEGPAPISLAVNVSASSCSRGELVLLKAKVENTETESAGMTMARLGIPSCTRLQTEELDSLVMSQEIAAYELKEGELLIYWRGITAGGSKQLTLSLVCETVGQCSGKSSSAYLYYGSQAKDWKPGMRVEITVG
jgi:hypothetical protein